MSRAYVERAHKRDLTIGIMGLGYVGLPLAEAFLSAGFRVLGFDIDETKVSALTVGKTYIAHIPDARIATMMATGRLEVTSDETRLPAADALLMCVPTPLNIHREPDISYVEKTTQMIARHLRPAQLVILESTTYPGTSDEVVRTILETTGLKAGADFAIAYSPEREDPGNIDFSTSSIPKVVGADTDAERDMAIAVYETITKVVPVSDMKTAEAVKLTENIFRLINIALVNELKTVFQGMDIDVWEVIDAAKTKPFGFMAFYPGPGLGGHCIPIDPFYLTWKARAHGETTRFIELAGDVVTRMPRIVIEALAEAMSGHLKKSVAGSRILVSGLAYKKNVDDMRESPSLHLIHMLRERGAHVDYHDPHIPSVPMNRDHPEFAGMKSVDLTEAALQSYDCVLISTDHDAVDYTNIVRHAPLVIDTRNAAKDIPAELRHKVVKA
ncbi:nucleotide sugar dehydrogenase [Hyphomonas sp.]|uniref:nucleotide sugar dehydrogenase n=1 Tax=Hyphomonas sp. TaxID=87 RepID=UPI001D3403D3|nr:nucleotide sugar dehydrogenase [Alphaproteobacteria bacterium]MBU4063907.1 nucleotide sugar dehydrogenase [Alphaproteobacteria bacterium]MBU4163295.1 nucleotide sugar dehydrogenase [Alphaproteobacteria bacterium]